LSDDPLQDLERYLAEAKVLCAYPETRGGWQRKCRVVLEGGVMVLQKPTDGTNAPHTGVDPQVAVRREVAAFVVAQALGWAHLVAPTVLRRMQPAAGGAECEVSLQVFWPEPLDALVDLGRCDPFDVWRAAAFDVAIINSDRGGNNWLGLGPDMAGATHLKLVDHGHAFTPGPVNSSFVAHVAGEPVPATIRDEITVGLNQWPDKRLLPLIGVVHETVRTRLRQVATGARLDAVT
jgi:hypothetical protein